MTTDLVEKCARAARRIEHRGCCTGAALEDTVNMPISVRERECILAVIDALADGVSDETLVPMARAIHDRTWEDDPFDGLPKDGAERGLAIEIARAGIRALSAAIRAAKSRETA